ncbi:MAG: hypothetical protein ACJAVK_000758, partial [Akkermansiaceae bacterium]
MSGTARVSPFQRIEITIFFLVLLVGTALICWESRLYFLLTLLLGMIAIYRKNLRSHHVWISRSFAFVTSAITFRSLQLGLSQFDLEYQKKGPRDETRRGRPNHEAPQRRNHPTTRPTGLSAQQFLKKDPKLKPENKITPVAPPP